MWNNEPYDELFHDMSTALNIIWRPFPVETTANRARIVFYLTKASESKSRLRSIRASVLLLINGWEQIKIEKRSLSSSLLI